MCAAVSLEGHGAGLARINKEGWHLPFPFHVYLLTTLLPLPQCAVRLVIDRSACLLCSRTGRACLKFRNLETDTSLTQRDKIIVETVFEIGVDAFATVLRIDPPNYRSVSKDWKVEEDKEELMAVLGIPVLKDILNPIRAVQYWDAQT